MELRGKVAIVTGAGQGLGEAIALEFAKAGGNLVLADIREDTIVKVRRKIKRMGRQALAIQMDVSKWEDAKKMAEVTMERFGRIDILVNNAAISPKRKGRGEGMVPLRALEIDDADWDTVMKVNLKGVFNCSKAVARYMIKRRSGAIINISSIAGILAGGPKCVASAHYSVSKAGVICLTKLLARELGPYNIRVNDVAPGRHITALSKEADPKLNAKMIKITPLRRFGKPSELARGVLFLASGKSAPFVTGTTLIIDGGRSL